VVEKGSGKGLPKAGKGITKNPRRTMKQYLELTRTVLESGMDRSDRTGVGTRSIDQVTKLLDTLRRDPSS